MQLTVFDTLPSTNDTAREAAMAGAPHLYTVLAKSQSAGRGRQGRSFLSPVGGTYFSVVLRPTLPPARYGAITPAAAVAVSRALRALAGVRTDIKWVNDLLLDGKKLAGLLATSGVDKNGAPFVVLGVGINTGGSVPAEIADIATAIRYPHPEALARAAVAALADPKNDPAGSAWLAYYRENAPFLGTLVTVKEGGTARVARALDILSCGALLVEEADGRKTALAGDEITLRPAQTDAP